MASKMRNPAAGDGRAREALVGLYYTSNYRPSPKRRQVLAEHLARGRAAVADMKRIVRDIENKFARGGSRRTRQVPGRQLVSARVWYRDHAGELKATPKGLQVDVRHAPAARTALDEAERLARAAGVLGNE